MKYDIARLKAELEKGNFGKHYIETVAVYTENLVKNDVPVIFDLNHLSMYLGINKTKLSRFIDSSFNYYNQKKISKQSGEPRVIHIPSIEMKRIQKFILHEILYHIDVSKNATGFKPRCSIKENASPHVKQEYILNLDIKDFFTSIKYNQVKKVFLEIGYNSEVSDALAKLTTYKGFLPQGSSTSPYLSNLVCKSLDKNLNYYVSINNINYTRYADDMTFSGSEKIKESINQIEKIIAAEGFRINKKKTRVISSNKRQEVTGLVVNDKININRKFIKQLRTEIYFCKKYGVSGHMRKKGLTYSNFKHYLYGKAYYIKMINREKGEKFLEELNDINWEY